MVRSELARYILLSVIIHAGLLLGIQRIMILPEAHLDRPVLIPVEIPTQTKQRPDPELKTTATGLTAAKEKDVPVNATGMADERPANSGRPPIVLYESPSLRQVPADDQVHQVAPTPQAGATTPRLPAPQMSSSRTPLVTPKGDEASSRQVVPAIRSASLQLTPIEPLPPPDQTLTNTGFATGPASVETAAGPAYTFSGKEVAHGPVIPAIKRAALHPAPVEPSPPDGAIPSDTSFASPLDAAETSTSPHYAHPGKTVPSKRVIPVLRKISPHIIPSQPSLPAEAPAPNVNSAAELFTATAASPPPVSQPLQQSMTTLAGIRIEEDTIPSQQPLPSQVDNNPVLMASILRIHSSPDGALVYVDGMKAGNTPLDLELTLGKHEVMLTLPNYYDWNAQVDLTKTDQSVPIYLDLLPVDK